MIYCRQYSAALDEDPGMLDWFSLLNQDKHRAEMSKSLQVEKEKKREARRKERKLKLLEETEIKRQREFDHLKQQLIAVRTNSTQTSAELVKLKELLKTLTQQIKDSETPSPVITTASNL